MARLELKSPGGASGSESQVSAQASRRLSRTVAPEAEGSRPPPPRRLRGPGATARGRVAGRAAAGR
jgi:hypothetical protein